MVLVGMSTFVNIGDYQQRRQDYLDAIQNLTEDFGVKIFRKPQILNDVRMQVLDADGKTIGEKKISGEIIWAAMLGILLNMQRKPFPPHL